MRHTRLTSLLLSPSLLSLTLSSLGAMVALVAANWSYIRPGSLLNDYLFGSSGITTVLQDSSNALSAISHLFDSPTAYNIAVAVVAVFIGLFVYVFLEGIDHIAAEATGQADGANYINDEREKKAVRKAAEIRTGLRIVTLIVWLCYIIFWVRVIVPFGILFGRVDTDQLAAWSSVWHSIAAFLLLVVSLHIQVIFLRLVVLRPRLFGLENFLVGRGGHDD